MKYRVALIGCGRISAKHIEAYLANSNDIELAGLCDLIIERAEEKASLYRKQIPDAKLKIYTDHRLMLDELKPDFVTIASETGYHPQISIDSIESGSHVIVEKPMALSTSDALRMIEVSRKAGKKLAVCYQNRFNTASRKLYNAIYANRFGRILHGMIQVRWNRNTEYYKQAPWRGTWELDGGTLMNQCSHGIDLLHWTMGGNVRSVYGATRRYLKPIEAEDFGSAIVEFDTGAVGIIEGTADVFPKNLSENLSIFGEKGTVVLGGLAVNKIETWRFADSETLGETEAEMIKQSEEDPPTVYGFGHTPLFADFIGALRENRDPLVTGEEGYRSVQTILAIYQSTKEGRRVEMPVDFDTRRMSGFFKS
jgi:predicted dehydrogenase